jgi:hypothetical protein
MPINLEMGGNVSLVIIKIKAIVPNFQLELLRMEVAMVFTVSLASKNLVYNVLRG